MSVEFSVFQQSLFLTLHIEKLSTLGIALTNSHWICPRYFSDFRQWPESRSTFMQNKITLYMPYMQNNGDFMFTFELLSYKRFSRKEKEMNLRW